MQLPIGRIVVELSRRDCLWTKPPLHSSILLRSKVFKIGTFPPPLSRKLLNKRGAEEERWLVSRTAGNRKTSFEINVKSTTRWKRKMFLRVWVSLSLSLMVMASVDGWLDPRRGKRETNNSIYYGVWRTNNIFKVRCINVARKAMSKGLKVDSTRIFFSFFFPSYYYISILAKEFNSKLISINLWN